MDFEKIRQETTRRQWLSARLKSAAFRLEAALVERAWAVVSAQREGMSVREIAASSGLSKSRVHQILQEQDISEIHSQLDEFRRRGWPAPGEPASESGTPAGDRLCDEAAALLECVDWLERLDRGEPVVQEVETERLLLDRKRVLNVLRRIAGDIDELARVARIPELSEEERRVARKSRFEVPLEERPRLSMRSQRALLRASLGLDPWETR